MAYWGSGRYPDLKSVASGQVEAHDDSLRVFRKCISFDSMKDENGWTALHWAAAKNYPSVAKKLTEYGNGIFLDSRTAKKLQLDNLILWASLTPLHIAAISGSVDVARVLICAGADVNAVDLLTGTPLDAALFWGHLGAAQALLAAGARGKAQAATTAASSSSLPGSPNSIELIQNEHMLHLGHMQQDFCQEAFFRSGLDVTPANNDFMSFVDKIARDDLQDEGQKSPNAVLDLGALISYQGDGSQRPHLGHKRSISLLPRPSFSDWGPSSQPEDAHSEPTTMTPRRFPGIRGSESMSDPLPPIPIDPREMELFTSARDNKTDILLRLIAEGRDVKSVDNNGWTLLHWAAAGDAAEAAEALIMNGALVNAQTTAEMDFNGRVWVESTPLHVASNLGHLNVAEVLLREGADTEVCDCTGGTPIHSAAYWGASDVAKVLVQFEANLMSETKGLSTPLHHACRSGHEEMAEILIMAGASVNAQNSTKQSPLHLAALAGHVALVKILVEYGADKGLKNKKAKTPLQCICRGMDIAPSAQKDLPGTKAILRSLLS